MKAYKKDIIRSIRKGRKRFLSIMIITILGVVMLTGLRAACVDLRQSADHFYDSQKLYDLSVMSSLGLTEDDVQAIRMVSGVDSAEGAYTQNAYTMSDHKKQSVEIRTLSKQGMNEPYVMEGTLPVASNEIAVTRKYLNESGKSIGDTLSIEEINQGNTQVNAQENNQINSQETETSKKLVTDTYTITAVVTDACDVNSAEGVVSFRSTSSSDYTFFVPEEAVQSDIYTAVYIRVSDAAQLQCYTKEYEDTVAQVKQRIETEVKETREEARTQQLRDEVKKQLELSMQAAAQGQMEQNYNMVAQNSNAMVQESEVMEQDPEVMAQDIDVMAQDAVAPAQWYVQDRSSLSGYANVKSDASSIEAIGTVFPIVFFIVAILISLTTITRLVEEERGLIGTYKALGFTDREIRRKYMVYAAGASTIGGIIGDLGGFILLPEIVFTIFSTMYDLPSYALSFDLIYGIGGALLFIVGITGATIIACEAELRNEPAALMRPKSPRAGQKVFLEKISWLWGKMTFLNKVTARNLFRYKKRLFMTIIGIMGCTALVLCGFAIKDSVTELMPAQYDHIYDYDLMAVASATDNDKLVSYVEDDSQVEEWVNVSVSSVKVKTDAGDENLQIIVVPDDVSLDGYINLDRVGGGTVDTNEMKDGVVTTRNVAQVLDFGEGDTIMIQNSDLTEAQVKVSAIVENYLGNMVYMTQSVYETMFSDYQQNAILANLSDACSDQPAYADELGSKEGVISTVSTANLKNEFSSAFAMINMVVTIIISMAAGLAFVVLFTLSTTNISERIRELSTIKVLGFYDHEVHLYVNKETLILTGIGVILGLPCGSVLGHALTNALRMPSIHFAVTIHPSSYVIAAVISFGFAIVVDMITNRLLDRIDPVEALKSIE